MPAPAFRLVCAPAALSEASRTWARELLDEGELALAPGDGGLSAVNEVAHALGMFSVPVLRAEDTAERQEETAIAYADGLPLVWIAGAFSDRAVRWARERGPMTLLVDAGGALSDDERGRIARFVAALGRQSE